MEQKLIVISLLLQSFTPPFKTNDCESTDSDFFHANEGRKSTKN